MVNSIACLEVIDRYVDIGRLATLVLAVLHTSNKGVELWGAVAGADGYRDSHGYAKRFKYIFAQCFEVSNLLLVGSVIYLTSSGS